MRSKCDDQLLTTAEINLVVFAVSTSAPSVHSTRLERVTYSYVVMQYGWLELRKKDRAHKPRNHAKVAKNWLRLFVWSLSNLNVSTWRCIGCLAWIRTMTK
jgi:hypothetical protein